MAGSVSVPSYSNPAGTLSDRWRALATSRWAAWVPFVAVVTLALWVNGWGLSQTGYGNTYYAAAVRSMTESWHNFFFGAFDPGGFITVDKPPVFLWVDAISVKLFGYSSWSLLLPSAVAGAAAVGLLWLLVRRYFGVGAATLAALVLALTPIAVAVNRLNLPEPFYVLALLGAAGCTLRSLDSRRWLAWTIGAGLLVGVAFNAKMLAAWIPGPALALAIVVGVPGAWHVAWRQWLPRVLVLGAVTMAASASWMLIVDTWPTSDRPYVGGSSDNTVSDLILGYNGLDRVEGEDGAGGPGGGNRGAAPNNGRFGPGDGNNNAANAARGPGGIIAGEPDALRMFDAANGGQIAWFLPFALIGGVVSLWRWRDDRRLRAAVVLWLGWMLLFGGVFSYTQGIYHSYYTAALAPGIAALVGISAVAVADLVRRHVAWLAAGVAMAGVTLYVQLVVAGRFDGFFDWVEPLSIAAVVAGGAVFAVAVWRRRLPAFAGMAIVVGGLLLIPGAWSTYETSNASLNTTLPQAGPRQGAAGRSFGSNAFDGGVAQLAEWLETNRADGATWDLAVTSAMNASTLIARYELSVMAIGGFSGRDPTITADDFAELVAAGEVRYVLATGAFGGGGGLPTGPGSFNGRNVPGGAPPGPGNFNGRNVPSGGGGVPGAQPNTSPAAGANAVLAAVRSACRPETDRSVPAQYRGALYDCGGRAAEMSAS